MKGYFMYGIVLSYEKYLEADTGNTIEEFLINTHKVQGVFTGRDNKFVIVGVVLKEVTETTPEPHEVPVMNVWEEAVVAEDVKQEFGVNGDFHYYYITR